MRIAAAAGNIRARVASVEQSLAAQDHAQSNQTRKIAAALSNHLSARGAAEQQTSGDARAAPRAICLTDSTLAAHDLPGLCD